MPVESTRETVATFLKELSERGPYERHFAADVTLTTVSTSRVIAGQGAGRVIAGRAAVARAIRRFHHEAFNAHLLIKVALVAEEHALVETDFVGTHTGTFRGIAATGREVSVPYNLVIDLRDGAITSLRGYLPVEQLLCQIGAPSPEGAG